MTSKFLSTMWHLRAFYGVFTWRVAYYIKCDKAVNFLFTSIYSFFPCCQDEVHERDKFCDFLLLSLRDCAKTNANLKVILMSATLNIDLFIDYFDNCPAITGNDKTQSVNGILQKCTLNLTNLFAPRWKIRPSDNSS